MSNGDVGGDTKKRTTGDAGQAVGDPKEKMKDVASALGIQAGGKTAVQVLQAVLTKIEQIKKDAQDEEAEDIASSVRARLGLAEDAGKDEVLLALSVQRDAQTSEALTSEVEAKNRVDLLVAGGYLNPNDGDAMTAAMSLSRSHPDRLERLFASTKPLLPPGRTTPPPGGPTGRFRTIANATREYRHDVGHQRATSMRAFVDLRLREAGQAKLTDEEAAGHAVTETVVG